MMIRSENNKLNMLSSALPVMLGVIAFFIVVGPRALYPTNIAWLGAGDPATHYLGWLFYRNSEWEFPIGLNSSYGLEFANSILYSDSNPLLAIIFKPISYLLPQTFQYFGIWLLLCFIFQALFGWKLLCLVTSSNLLRLLGAGIIVFAPPMIWRLHGHLSLVGHFVIVAALYFSLNAKLRRRKLCWGILIAVTALIHAYLLAMVLAIWIADLVGRAMKSQLSVRISIYEFFALFFLTGVVCWQAGYFSVGAGASSAGYGLYRMNILSPFDSSGWSYILRDLPEATGDYEGFNYLGLGTIFLLISSFPAFWAARKELTEAASEYWYLALLFLAFTLFAISNAIAIGPIEFRYTLPDSFLELANVFRASGRIFWPVFYLITFLSIAFAVRRFDGRTAGFVLGLALTVQVLDTSAGWLPIRKTNMVESSAEWSSPLVSQFWSDASKKYQNVRRIPVGNSPAAWQDISYYAGKNGLAADAVYLARVSSISFENAKKRSYEALSSGAFDQDSLYILDDSEFRSAFISGNLAADLFAKIDGLNVVAPNWKNCVDCRPSVDEIKINDLFKPLAVGERISFNSAGYGVDYLGQGWSSPEPWGTWSDSSSSVVFLPTLPKEVHSILIDFNALITPSHPAQRVEIIVNGVQTASMTIKESSAATEVKLPEAAKLDSFSGIKIEFLLPDAARPVDVGLGEDGRTLALGLLAITLK